MAQQYIPRIPTLRRLRQKNHKVQGQPGLHGKILTKPTVNQSKRNKQTNKQNLISFDQCTMLDFSAHGSKMLIFVSFRTEMSSLLKQSEAHSQQCRD